MAKVVVYRGGGGGFESHLVQFFLFSILLYTKYLYQPQTLVSVAGPDSSTVKSSARDRKTTGTRQASAQGPGHECTSGRPGVHLSTTSLKLPSSLR